MAITMLQQLYQGELRPEEQYRPRLKAICEKRKLLREQEQVFLNQLDDNQKREMIRILDEFNLIGSVEMEDVYIQGMKTGARLVAELLDN